MKTLAIAFLLFQTTFVLGAAGKPNPADFPVKVHVVFSRYVYGEQKLEAIIDGERVELTGSSLGVLALGDYSARITPKVHGPKNPNTYDVYKGYEFLMPDGNLRTYQVTAFGQSEFPAPPAPPPPAPSDTPAPQPPPAPPPMPAPTIP